MTKESHTSLPARGELSVDRFGLVIRPEVDVVVEELLRLRGAQRVDITGAPGMGKTITGMQIADRLAEKGARVMSMNIVAGWPVDHGNLMSQIARRVVPDTDDGRAALSTLQESVTTFQTRYNLAPFAFAEGYTDARRDVSREILPERRIKQIFPEYHRMLNDYRTALAVPHTAADKPAVLFFDHVDRLRDPDIRILTEDILSPLTRQRKGKVVTLSHRVLQWPPPEMQRSGAYKNVHLMGLNQAESTFMFRKGGRISNELATSLYDLSQGNPTVNQLVAEVIASKPAGGEPAVLKQAARTILDTYVRQTICLGMANEQVDSVVAASIPRSFQEKMLTHMLRAVAPERVSKWGEAEYYRELDAMKTARPPLLEWKNHTLSVEEPTRKIISASVQVGDPEGFSRLHTAARDGYGALLGRPLDSRAPYMVEELYHQAVVDPAGVVDVLRQRLNELPSFRGDPHVVREDAQKLMHALDSDTDLLALLDDTQREAVFQGILDFMNTFAITSMAQWRKDHPVAGNGKTE